MATEEEYLEGIAATYRVGSPPGTDYLAGIDQTLEIFSQDGRALLAKALGHLLATKTPAELATAWNNAASLMGIQEQGVVELLTDIKARCEALPPDWDEQQAFKPK